VLISAIIAYNLTKLPEWTTWGVLGAVALWDIVAVLAPRGPLKVLVETAEERNEPIPGLVYEGHGIKLGLGDFVFYSLLVGRACLSSITAFAACAIAVLAGLCATLALLPVLERVLPALPISVRPTPAAEAQPSPSAGCNLSPGRRHSAAPRRLPPLARRSPLAPARLRSASSSTSSRRRSSSR